MKNSRTRKRSVEERGSRLNVNEEALYLGIRKHMRFSVIDRVSAAESSNERELKRECQDHVNAKESDTDSAGNSAGG
jgi:hypothetical protein